MREIRPIHSEEDLKRALREINRLWKSKPGTPKGDRLEVLAILIETYEKEHFPIDPPNPIEAIKFRLEQQGLDRKVLEAAIGSRPRVSEVLNGRRSLTPPMIPRLSALLDIPADVLMRSAIGQPKHSRRK